MDKNVSDEMDKTEKEHGPVCYKISHNIGSHASLLLILLHFISPWFLQCLGD